MAIARPASAMFVLAVLQGCAGRHPSSDNTPPPPERDGSLEAGTGTGGGGSDASVASDSPEALEASNAPDVARPPDPCDDSGGCQPGEWVDVTPATVNLTTGDCGNYGTKSAQVDPMRPQDIYTSFNCQGIWKSTDYGQTWNGPVNTGTSGTMVGDCAAAIAIAAGDAGGAPILYESCIRGAGIGFWRSSNGGVDWTNYNVLPDGGAPSAVNQQFYAPAVDPYDANHLLMAGHATDVLVESFDGGQTWSGVALAPGMVTGDGGTGGINFVNTGSASTTRGTWLWLAAAVGTVGTWRTADSGASWTLVDQNEHINGSMHSEVYQPLPPFTGDLYMAGQNSALGAGVLRSTDFGKTWAHVGLPTPEAVVFGTTLHVYGMYGWGIGAGQTVAPGLEVGEAPGTGTWSAPGTPPAMTQGPGQVAVTNDGTNSIVVVANYNAGLWRYVEPSN